ncbi:hypothetical protein EKD00_06810 [Chlorobium phaeovibrioides]|uniref:Uncharacterized protein n=2 Tax=Chlorobium phaeovibrioides TaxID=1094 RepID=A0A432AXN5_CHLPH|nr:hypothetical protein [Chlorobium phaeovibrioides]MWV54103.1 hypothetical protein [Chlorobium phaeovibrioides]RTY35098.1 hypothetical protein EKD00_06810 [Chlorobium phaeovibrioides]RTY40105.1 hypothetical protein EKD02_01555 [Chlorobium phaeovibrioides]HCD35602.1 hypothetical protein [Chlorobium sp.]
MAKQSLFKEMKKTFMLHAIAAHFSNGLIPVAVLYLLLAIPGGNVFFEHTVKHIIIITLLAIPVSFASGIHDWKTKYRGAKAPVFMKKIRLSIILFVLCFAGVGLRLALPDVMAEAGILRWLYIGILLSMLPVVTLLGHYGGKLASQPRPAKPAGGGKESA